MKSNRAAQASAVASLLIDVGVQILAAWAANRRRSADHSPAPPDRDLLTAARLLGVSPDADADAVRRALRAKLASTGLHPDQGGDLERAQELVAAKNFPIERSSAAVRLATGERF
jgi:hypothetical protein